MPPRQRGMGGEQTISAHEYLLNATWRILIAIRTLLIRTGVLRLKVGRQTLDGALFRLGFLVVPPPSKEVVAVLPTGEKMRVPGGHADARKYATGTYEPAVTRLLVRSLRQGMCFVDVGAHIGYYTILASGRVGTSGMVYAFEPDPWAFDYLSKNVEENGLSNVRAVNCAVSDREGTSTLHSEVGAGGSNLIAPTLGPFRRTTATVNTTTLDTFFASRGWPRVDLIKLDIEGGEVAALRGMRRLLEHNPEIQLITEFAPDLLTRARISPEEYFATLRELGFHTFRVVENELREVQIPADLKWLLSSSQFRGLNLLVSM